MPADGEESANKNLDEQSEDWSRDTQKFAVLTWISFLSASVGTMLVFAFIDPLVLVDELGVDFLNSSNGGYAVGFFFLWIYTWISGWLVLRLIRRKRNWPRRP